MECCSALQTENNIYLSGKAAFCSLVDYGLPYRVSALFPDPGLSVFQNTKDETEAGVLALVGAIQLFHYCLSRLLKAIFSFTPRFP